MQRMSNFVLTISCVSRAAPLFLAMMKALAFDKRISTSQDLLRFLLQNRPSHSTNVNEAVETFDLERGQHHSPRKLSMLHDELITCHNIIPLLIFKLGYVTNNTLARPQDEGGRRLNSEVTLYLCILCNVLFFCSEDVLNENFARKEEELEFWMVLKLLISRDGTRSKRNNVWNGEQEALQSVIETLVLRNPTTIINNYEICDAYLRNTVRPSENLCTYDKKISSKELCRIVIVLKLVQTLKEAGREVHELFLCFLAHYLTPYLLDEIDRKQDVGITYFESHLNSSFMINDDLLDEVGCGVETGRKDKVEENIEHTKEAVIAKIMSTFTDLFYNPKATLTSKQEYVRQSMDQYVMRLIQRYDVSAAESVIVRIGYTHEDTVLHNKKVRLCFISYNQKRMFDIAIYCLSL